MTVPVNERSEKGTRPKKSPNLTGPVRNKPTSIHSQMKLLPVNYKILVPTVSCHKNPHRMGYVNKRDPK
jgi:hypothetical protein